MLVIIFAKYSFINASGHSMFVSCKLLLDYGYPSNALNKLYSSVG